MNEDFLLEVERIRYEKDVEYIDAVIIWCEENNMEVEDAAYWIKRDPSLKSKIQFEAENLNIVKRTIPRLPLD